MKNIIKVISILPLVTFLYSCGNQKSSVPAAINTIKEKSPEAEIVPQAEGLPGTYKATFETINPKATFKISGSGTFLVKDNILLSYIRVFGSSPKTIHYQNVYSGARCPTMADDTNGDGFLDINEGNKVWGKVIVPVDNDLHQQLQPEVFWPESDLSGFYFHEKETSLDLFLDDLKYNDESPNDHVRKLSLDESFTFKDKVVVIQGIDESFPLPPTVTTERRYLAGQTLPIACGVLKKTQPVVGRPDDGSITENLSPLESYLDVPAPPDELDGVSQIPAVPVDYSPVEPIDPAPAPVPPVTPLPSVPVDLSPVPSAPSIPTLPIPPSAPIPPQVTPPNPTDDEDEDYDAEETSEGEEDGDNL